ncbi:hypothetical protein G6N74_08530 [Mesorhizobium sp. CGMCC 1.15528]|uniref:Uncharacterized protein n=1 Tax=Mesorhizobium zhangyense TaxID=1776730 RepID=A0A7C9VCF5_9HYPH|nr:hypothetical protein [Mesorhizobium zhangyense]NGN41108.1 hypothetical protein [Mesorhizobium zhangyense]
MGNVEEDRLASVLSGFFALSDKDVFSSTQPDGADGFYNSIGKRNLALVHSISQPDLWKLSVDLDFIEPIPVRAFQMLADGLDLTIAVSREDLFPDEAGTAAGYGEVIFSKAASPVSGLVLFRDDQEAGASSQPWKVWNAPLRPLPDSIVV